MKFIISGNSVSSKVLTTILTKFSLAKSITVIDPFSKTKGDDLYIDNSPLFVGLWSPSLKVLNELGVLGNISQCEYLRSSSYRTVRGERLLKPKTNMGKLFQADKSLLFVERRQLLDSLDLNMNQVISNSSTRVTFLDDSIQDITGTPGDSLVIQTVNGLEIDADLVVACDGSFSRVRELVYPGWNPLAYRGYKVYRGHSSLPSSSFISTTNKSSYLEYDNKTSRCLEGFQTWGKSRRFASVPTTIGNAWFTAISSPPPDSIENTKSGDWRALRNGTFSISSTEYEYLLSQFNNWHQPIPDLIYNTKVDDIACNYAYAFKETISGGLSGMMHSHTKTIDRRTNSLHELSSGGIAFVGDAAYTLDPILAQGAGVGMEEAALLAHALKTHFSSTLLYNQTKSIERLQKLQSALQLYEAMREKRIKILHNLSNVSQRIGHIESEFECKLRDILLLNMNRVSLLRNMGESIFDLLISYSIQSKVYEIYKD